MILQDTNEPVEIEHLLAQVCPVIRSPLNRMSMSDYFFGTADGRRLQFGRVQAGELLSDIDSMEDELRRYYNSADENYQIIEGIFSTVPLSTFTQKQLYAIQSGKVVWDNLNYEPKLFVPKVPSTRPVHKDLSFSYKVEFITDKTGVTLGVLTHGRAHDIYFPLIYVWIHRLAEAGISTYSTLNWQETARLLTLIYKNEQKPPEEHTTLQRIVKPRLQIKEQDPFVKALMFLSSAYKLGIGEKTAKLIADHYANLGDLYLSSVAELTSIKDIGRNTAEKILKALGRTI